MTVVLINYPKTILETIYIAGRTCYSPETPLEIIMKPENENSKDKMIKFVSKILESGHHSVLEHINFTFAITGVSRALLAQISRHRHISLSVQSQRYVEIKEDYWSLQSLLDDALYADENKSIEACTKLEDLAKKYFVDVTPANSYHYCQSLAAYLDAIAVGAKPEDARMHLPNATKTNMVLTTNLRELIHICKLRLCSRAQKEIREMVQGMADGVLAINDEDTSWLKGYLQPQCEILGYCPELQCCGRKKRLGELINGN